MVKTNVINFDDFLKIYRIGYFIRIFDIAFDMRQFIAISSTSCANNTCIITIKIKVDNNIIDVNTSKFPRTLPADNSNTTLIEIMDEIIRLVYNVCNTNKISNSNSNYNPSCGNSNNGTSDNLNFNGNNIKTKQRYDNVTQSNQGFNFPDKQQNQGYNNFNGNKQLNQGFNNFNDNKQQNQGFNNFNGNNVKTNQGFNFNDNNVKPNQGFNFNDNNVKSNQ